MVLKRSKVLVFIENNLYRRLYHTPNHRPTTPYSNYLRYNNFTTPKTVKITQRPSQLTLNAQPNDPIIPTVNVYTCLHSFNVYTCLHYKSVTKW